MSLVLHLNLLLLPAHYCQLRDPHRRFYNRRVQVVMLRNTKNFNEVHDGWHCLHCVHLRSVPLWRFCTYIMYNCAWAGGSNMLQLQIDSYNEGYMILRLVRPSPNFFAVHNDSCFWRCHYEKKKWTLWTRKLENVDAVNNLVFFHNFPIQILSES